MHRIDPPHEPSAFAKYRGKHPESRDWDAFGSVRLSCLDPAVENEMKTLKEHVIDILAENQKGLCAYCEMKLPDNGDRRIEHFHPKSDMSTEHNWMLDWQNLLAVCHGGKSNKVWATIPAELHCDAYKGDSRDPILNPYSMPKECLFILNRSTGELKANEEACKHVEVCDNPLSSTEKLVEQTIRVLNLNCRVLCDLRKSLCQAYKRIYQKEQKTATGSVRDIIARKWFGGGKIMELYTTRRCLLGCKVDQYL